MRRLLTRLSLLFVTGLLAATPVAAQGQGGKAALNNVPPGFEPPIGMCRIWLDGVPAGQQPAPTDCASAVRNRPANGRVVFGQSPRPTRKSWPSGVLPAITRELPEVTRELTKRGDNQPAREKASEDGDSRDSDAKKVKKGKDAQPSTSAKRKILRTPGI